MAISQYCSERLIHQKNIFGMFDVKNGVSCG